MRLKSERTLPVRTSNSVHAKPQISVASDSGPCIPGDHCSGAMELRQSKHTSWSEEIERLGLDEMSSANKRDLFSFHMSVSMSVSMINFVYSISIGIL